MRVKASLFLKIYATLIAALIVLALLLGGAWRLMLDRPDPSDRFPHRIAEAILPPADAPFIETRRAIERLARALDAEIILRGPDGRRIAYVGDPEVEPRPEGVFGTKRRVWRVRLADGRALIARFEAPLRPPFWRLLSALLVAALAVAVASLPMVWLLTRRLEKLRGSVDAFGRGDLSVRADVKGSDEVAVLARSFNASAERIEQLVGTHRSLLANASHELRSPLTRLRLAIDLQADSPSEARRAEIIRNLEEIDALIEEILLASRLDRADAPLSLDTIDLSAIAADEAERLSLTFDGAPLRMQGDAVLLRRLIRNLLENAVKHGAPPVELKLEPQGQSLLLTLRDHGAGVAEADQARIFEPFFRPRGRSESAGGWGLGLSLVRQITERHGGTIACTNAPGGGALFTVRLPLLASSRG
jgi:two-component system, OmpR family, sensor kinase